VTEIRSSGNPTNQAKCLLISQSHLVERSGITGDHTTIAVPSQSLWIKLLTETEKSGSFSCKENSFKFYIITQSDDTQILIEQQ
jgi:hypothetical protein